LLVSAGFRVGKECAQAYDDAVPIRLRLREFRHALGLTQTELATRAGVRRATVSRLENSRVTAIDLAVLEKLADQLGVEPGFLLSRTPPRTPTEQPPPPGELDGRGSAPGNRLRKGREQ
jgi:transcriptional regulator with XRE-family HTH domain